MKRHKQNTKTFDELTYSEQAKSINAQIAILIKAVKAHINKSDLENRDKNATLLKCINQLSRAITNISQNN